MKATYNSFLPKETEKKVITVGSRNGSQVTYKKADYLTPSKVAKKFNITTVKAEKLMKSLIFNRAIFGLNGHKSQIVVRLGTSDRMYLHPMGTAAFQKYLDEQKD